MPIEVVSVDEAGEPIADFSTAPAMSDAGGVIVFEAGAAADASAEDGPSGDAGDDAERADQVRVGDAAGPAEATQRRVWVRDRVGSTSKAVAEIDSRAPGISGNGCIVAYVVANMDDVPEEDVVPDANVAGEDDVAPEEGVAPDEDVAEISAGASLVAVDRCAADPDLPLPIGSVLDSVEAPVAEFAAPVLSADGATIAWSTGDEIRRYGRSTTSGLYERTHAFDAAADVTSDDVTGAELDMSADGATIVYLAGPGPSPFAPSPANVHVWNQGDPSAEPTIEVVSLTAAGLPGAADSSSPSVSADGSFVVFGSDSLDLASVGEAPVTAPFVAGFDRVGRSTQVLVEDATRPDVSGDARHIVYERNGGLRVVSSTDAAGASTDREIDELADANPLGRASISQFGRWVVFDSAALGDAGAAGSDIWLADLVASDDSVLDTTTTTVVPPTTTDPVVSTTEPGSPPQDTTPPSTPSSTPSSTPTSTTAPTTSGSGIDGPASFFPPTASSFPPFTFPPIPSATPRSGFPSSTPFGGSAVGGSTFGGSTFDPPSSSGVVADTTSLVFEPTIIESGRRIGSVELTNSSTSNIEITSVAVEPIGPFTLVSDGCTRALAAGDRCTVEVQFAPIAVGPASASLVLRLADGSFVAVTLSGDGTPQPTLDVVPAVAGKGQTVTVFGVGFPGGSTVELRRDGVAILDPVIVEPDGTFAHVMVVLPNTPTGPMELTVLGQPDAFDDAVAEMLVSTRGADSADVALRTGVLGVR